MAMDAVALPCDMTWKGRRVCIRVLRGFQPNEKLEGARTITTSRKHGMGLIFEKDPHISRGPRLGPGAASQRADGRLECYAGPAMHEGAGPVCENRSLPATLYT